MIYRELQYKVGPDISKYIGQFLLPDMRNIHHNFSSTLQIHLAIHHLTKLLGPPDDVNKYYVSWDQEDVTEHLASLHILREDDMCKMFLDRECIWTGGFYDCVDQSGMKWCILISLQRY